MKRIARLTERDLSRIVKRVLNEGVESEENVSTSDLGFEVFDSYRNKKLPIQSVSVTERAININLEKNYMWDDWESIRLDIINNNEEVPLFIKKGEILNGNGIVVGDPYNNNSRFPVFIKVKDVTDIQDFTIVLYGNFYGGNITINITSKGSSVNRINERDLSRIVRRVINEHPMGLLDDVDVDSSKKMSLKDFIYNNMGMRFVSGQIPESVISKPGDAYPLNLETNKGEFISIGADGMVTIQKIK